MREFSSCSCFIALPGLAWALLSKTYKPFSSPLYMSITSTRCPMSLSLPTETPRTHIRKKRTGCTFQKADSPSIVAAAINLSHRFARGILKMSIKPEERGGGWDRDKKRPIRPFIQTSSLQHCYYNAHKGDRYTARNRIRAIVTSR